MSVEDTKVSTQIEFLILQTLYLDEDYQRYGFELKNLQAALAENKSLWHTVGNENQNKYFAGRLESTLRDLDGKKAIRNKGNGVYVPGSQFSSYLSDLVLQLYVAMDFDINFEQIPQHENPTREMIMKDVANLKNKIIIDYQAGKYKKDGNEKNLVMLTDEQVIQLLQLVVKFGHEPYIEYLFTEI